LRDPIIGIDLGTSNTVVAHVDATGKPVVLADDNGYKIHPSVVSFHPSGGVVVGAAAKQRKVIDPQNTIYSVKRLIGRSFRSPEVQTAMSRAPFVIKEGENQAPLIVTRAGEFAVPEISAIVLDYVRNIASERLASVSVNRAVVTVPASFNDAQRSATATAGAIANLDVVRVLNEPTAAALAYGNTRNLNEIIAVYDFGGGTFDITILKLEDQVYEVLGTSGDTFLGGDDLDERIVDKMVAKFLAENRVDLRTNEVSMMRLRAVAEQTKIELSRRSRAVVRIDEIAYGARGKPLNLNIEITRDEFVSQVADIIDQTFPVCQEALALAGLGIDQINDVILVGGTTKIPYVRDQVSKFFAKAPRTDVNPEDAVAIGAALQASTLERAQGRVASTFAAFDPIEEPTVEQSVVQAEELPAPTQTPEFPTDIRRPHRPTAGYAATPKPDTSYAVTRPGAKDVYGKLPTTPTTPASGAAIPLARLTKQIQPSEVAAAQAKTTAPGMVAQRPATPPPVPAKPVTARVPAQAPRPPAVVTSDTSASFSGDFETNPSAATYPSPGAPDSFSDVDQLGARLDSLSDSAQGDSYTDADAVAPSKSPASFPGVFAERDRPAADSFSEADQLARSSTFGDFETQEKLVPPAPEPTPDRPVPASMPNARTMIAAQPPAARPFARLSSDFDDDDRHDHDIRPASTAKGFPPMPPPGAPNPAAATIPTQMMPPAGLAPLAKTTIPSAAPPPAPAPSGPRPAPFVPGEVPILPGPVVLDVTPRGLGIGTVAGFCEELIRRNSRLPAAQKKLFTTSRDRQDHVRIVVCQGESRRMDNNTIIGDLVLGDIPPRPRGETSIEVTFSLDVSGILQVRARDAQTGREQSASLDLVGGMAKQDVAASRDRIAALRR